MPVKRKWNEGEGKTDYRASGSKQHWHWFQATPRAQSKLKVWKQVIRTSRRAHQKGEPILLNPHPRCNTCNTEEKTEVQIQHGLLIRTLEGESSMRTFKFQSVPIFGCTATVWVRKSLITTQIVVLYFFVRWPKAGCYLSNSLVPKIRGAVLLEGKDHTTQLYQC